MEFISNMISSARFTFNFPKFVAVMTYMAQRVSQLTKLRASKLLFFADKYHLLKYGRPIIGDRYVKMEYGPVPSQALDWVNELISPMRIRGVPRPQLEYVESFLETRQPGRWPIFKAKQDPDLSLLSESDIEALTYSIKGYGKKTVTQICNAGHRERAWREAPDSGVMDYRLFFNEEDPEQKAMLEFIDEQAENEYLLQKLSAE